MNNILQQAQIQTREDIYPEGMDMRGKMSSSKINKTMHRVREATMKHLRDIGVTINSTDVENGSVR